MVIELKNICAGYGGEDVLKNVSLDLPEGGLTAIVGTNGSGKSTLLKAAVGILPLTAGEILLDQTPAAGLSRRDIAKKISYLAQGKSVPSMTVEQMVLHGRFPHLKYPRRYSKMDREISRNALRQMGIADLADRPLPSLSGGLRQKAYISMALAQDTGHILLDEPTTYLDITGQLELMKTLLALAAKGKGVVAVMHDLPLAFGCADRIVVLQNGGIAACDTPEKVCKSGLIRDIFGVELQYCPAENYYHYQYDFR